jgi:putative tryptophan/tyrosine transport system substrate-binding protein
MLDVKRREFITLLGGAAAAWPLAARAQQRPTHMIGFLSAFDENNSAMRSMATEMFETLSRSGGRNVEVAGHWTAGNLERTRAAAKELVALRPDVLVALGTPATAALQKETSTIAIVFVGVTDPIGAGLVASLARPGGNITGLSNPDEAFGGKLLSLLKTVAPRIKRAAVMFNPETAPRRGLYHLGSFEGAARSLAIEPVMARVHSDADIEQAIATLPREHGGLVLIPDTFVNSHQGTVITAALRNVLPTIFDGSGFVEQGGLLRYGPDFPEMYRRAASYLDRILRGARPSDLPVELPTKYRLAINLKTAKAIGIDVSPDMLSLADKVFE